MTRYYFFGDDLKDLEKEIDRLHQKLTKFRNEAVEILARRDRGLDTEATYNALSAMYNVFDKQLNELSRVRNHAILATLPKTGEKRVCAGKNIVVKDLTIGKTLILNIRSYWIKYNDDNKVSYNAPLPDLLMGGKVGEIYEGIIGGARKKYKIKEIL
ncbi:MAG: hypothetical protein KAS07_02395 [Candidatus Pacebacteria bacterium]|nr:hypothetical protein [Candidatus Paceibacterota bacterium]